MIELEISGNQFIRARKKAIDMGTIANSITNGGGNLAGFIGEILVTDYINAKEQNTYDYEPVLQKLKPDYLVHGDDWKIGLQSKMREKVIKILKEFLRRDKSV